MYIIPNYMLDRAAVLELLDKYERHQRRRDSEGKQSNYYWDETALSKRIEGRLEAVATLRAELEKMK